jgi:hypothetical protein
VCASTNFTPFNEERYELDSFAEQDPELAAYSGHHVWLVRCRDCGFAQPETLPVLPNFFRRIYDQRWSAQWLDAEFEAGTKQRIFDTIFAEVGRRTRDLDHALRLLDVGAHVGAFVDMAGARGWCPEGLEWNTRTASYAERRTGVRIHRSDLEALAAEGRRYDVITLTDVLEHMPEPCKALRASHRLLHRGGWVAVKVPHGRLQLAKQRVRGVLDGRPPAIATNLVHVNHFGPSSLRMALRLSGFEAITVSVGAPELSPRRGGLAGIFGDALRMSCYGVARIIPCGARSPLAFNLQAFARRGV